MINGRMRVLLVLCLRISLAMHQIKSKVESFEMRKCVHTFTKSCSCSRTHTVLRRVGYHVSCLSSEGTRKIWLTLSFSLISASAVNSLFAANQRKLNPFYIYLSRYVKHLPTNTSGYAKSSALGTKCLISL